MKRNRQPQKGKAVAAAKAESPKKKRKITKTELPPFKAEPTKETTSPKVAKLSGKKNIKKPQSAKNKAEKVVVAGGKVLPKIAPEEDFAEAESESEEEVFSNAEDEEAAYWESVAGEFEDDDSDFAGGDFAEGGFSSDEELDEKSLKALRDEFGGGKDEDENDEEGSADEKGDEKEADEKPEEEDEEEEEGEEKATIQRDATGANMKVTAKFAAAFGKILEESQQEKVQGAADPILTNFRLPGKDKRVEREKKKRKEQRELVIKKRLLADKDHLIPTHLHTLEEKALRKLATRGVVALFNAVKKQQQQVPEIAEKMKAKNPETVEKLSKAKFLELLQQAETSAGLKKPMPSLKNEKPQTTKLQIQQPLQKQPQARKGSLLGDPSSSQGNNGSGSKQPNWDVLRDDFMMGAKLKDFDKAEAANNNKK